MILAEPLPVGARPEEMDDHGQRPVDGLQPRVQYAARPFWTTDDSWRTTLLPYQRNGDTGRLANPNADHLQPNGSGGYTAIRGAGIGRPQMLAPVAVYHATPQGTLTRAGRVAVGNPTQWTTTAAISNGILAERAEPVRWPVG